MAEFVWTPTHEEVESANLTRLARRLGVEPYQDLHRISVDEPDRFWPVLIEDLGLEFSEPWSEVVNASRGVEWARWFVGGKLNVACNCVHKWAAGELAEEEAARPLLERAGGEHVRRSDPETGRFRAPVPFGLHVGDDRKAEGSAARAGRLPRLDRPRGRVSDERQARRPHPLRD